MLVYQVSFPSMINSIIRTGLAPFFANDFKLEQGKFIFFAKEKKSLAQSCLPQESSMKGGLQVWMGVCF